MIRFRFSLLQTKSKSRQIIQNLSGNIRSGQLTAFLGPNGAGKSTLLKCLAGKRKSGLSGRIFVTYNGCKPRITFSYYSQNDVFNELLTVEESIVYASQLKFTSKIKALFNDNKIKQNSLLSLTNQSTHRLKAEKLIEDLHLKKCSKTVVNHCSGGQRRRLSIALELIFSPTILLLDEPTSGLDSLSTLQSIELLKKWSNRKSKPMIIAMVIHQPNAKLLSYFDNLYIISSTGQCIYEGTTVKLIDHMSNFNLQCPKFYNPSDFAIEVASGDLGLDAIHMLAEFQRQHFKDNLNNTNCIEMTKVIKETQRHTFGDQLWTTWILTKRCFKINLRDRKQYFLQFNCVLFMLLLLYILHLDNKVGINDGCIQKPSVDYIKSLQVFDFLNSTTSTFPNWAFIFYSSIFMVFISMLPTLLSFPLEVSIFCKEHSNGWYSMSSYFLAKNIAEIPQNIIFPLIYCIGSYIITEQILDPIRFIGFITIMILLSFLTQGLGFFISALFVNNIIASTVIGAVVNIPLLLFAGLLIKIQSIPHFLRPFTYISYFRLTFESIMIFIYGFDRCQPIERLTIQSIKQDFGDHIIPIVKCVYDYDSDLVDNMTLAIDYFNEMIDKSNSFALLAFEYKDSDINMCLFCISLEN
ncbi:ATP-binding cassette sub-family G member 1-like [Oppia nitens]|uniref:ATP-binding cassette sub-family G member 1-like n=1 Tax=Oppia nitens TaxID=1686743 RepID=UPI0023DC9E90|nr:ATP-binding cassette sub-family G member 1-like [Oppia nitens]